MATDVVSSAPMLLSGQLQPLTVLHNNLPTSVTKPKAGEVFAILVANGRGDWTVDLVVTMVSPIRNIHAVQNNLPYKLI